MFGFGKDFYLLSSDGQNSRVHYTQNIFASNPVWTKSETIPGQYTVIRPTSTQGSIYLYSRAGQGAWSYEWTFDSGLEGWEIMPQTGGASLFGSWDDGGVTYADLRSPASNGAYWRGAGIERFDIDGTTITKITVTIDCTQGVDTAAGDPPCQGISINGSTIIFERNYSEMITGSPVDIVVEGSWSVNSMRIDFRSSVGTSSASYSGYIKILNVAIEGEGVNPFGSVGGATTVFSDDYGATFADAENVGASPGLVGGFDTIKIGTVALAGAANQVMIADTNGGSYEPYGDPMPEGSTPSCILIPRRQFGSTTPNTGSTPQYLVASYILTEDNAALWKVTNGGTTFTDITPEVDGEYGIAVSPNCLAANWFTGRIAAVLQVGSLPRLFVSNDAGSTWLDRGVLNENAQSVAFRKGDTTGNQLFIGNGTPAHSPNAGSTINNKPHPSPAGAQSDPLQWIYPYG